MAEAECRLPFPFAAQLGGEGTSQSQDLTTALAGKRSCGAQPAWGGVYFFFFATNSGNVDLTPTSDKQEAS